MKKFFETKYRVIDARDGWFRVQEHNWWDLIYGWWHYVGVSQSIDGAIQIIKDEKAKKQPPTVVYQE